MFEQVNHENSCNWIRNDGRAAAYDMARSQRVQSVTLADNDNARLKQAVQQVNQLAGNDKVRAVQLDAADTEAALEDDARS